MKKESFIVHHSAFVQVNMLTDEQAGQLFKALFMHSMGNGGSPADPMANLVYAGMTAQMDIDNVKYAEKCKKNAETAAKREEKKREITNVNERDANITNSTDIDNDIDVDNDVDSERDAEVPTLDQIRKYVFESKLNVKPSVFYEHYNAEGWDKVKDWKAKLRLWHEREKNVPAKRRSKQHIEAHDRDWSTLEQQLVAAQEA